LTKVNQPYFRFAKIIFALLLVTPIYGFSQDSTLISKIAFGSCAHQDHPLPIFDVVVKHQPDLFVFLGDNIYGDTKNMEALKAKYNMLESKESFQNLKKNVDIIATWDDHDYGWNDAGKEYPKKEESKEIFLDFFDEPRDSERRKHKGIYTSYMYEFGGKKLQIILLDVRTFRDQLKPYSNEVSKDDRFFYSPYYGIHNDDDLSESNRATFLGGEQWTWLEEELKKPADLRLIGSGSQFGIEYNSYEAWANFPNEQLKMLNLINKTQANGVLFITGDVHYAEVSKLRTNKIYPIYDITSSGLSSTWHFATPNLNRIEGPVMENHFGMLTIDWEKTDPTVKMEIWDILDNQRIEYTIQLSEISFE
jgi:alkaline phosphatase D